MEKFSFNTIFLQDIHKLEKEQLILEYLVKLSKKAIGKTESEFFDIKNIPIDDLRKIPNTFVEIVGDNVKFTGEESLHFIYSYFLFSRTTIDNIEKLKAFLTEIRKENHKLGYKVNQIINANVIILYENSGHNISQELLDENKIVSNEYNMVTFPFVTAIPYLNLELNSFLAFLSIFQKRNNSSNTILSVDINESIREYSKLQTEKGRLLLEAIINKTDDETIPLIPDILLGLSETHGLKKIYNETSIIYKTSTILNIKKMAVYSFGYFNYNDVEERQLLENTIKLYTEIVTKMDLDYLNEIVQASYYLIKYTDEPLTWIEKISTVKNDFLQYNVANFLNRHSEKYKNKKWYRNCLLNLSDVNINNSGCIEKIEFVLLAVVHDNSGLYLDFLNEWIRDHEAENKNEHEKRVAKLFLSSLHELYRSNQELLERFITECFNMDDYKFHISASSIISELGTFGHKDIRLSKFFMDTISANDICFILCKVVGYVIDWNELCVLVFSAIDSSNSNKVVTNYIEEVFVDYIGYNYPDYSIEYLKANYATFNNNEQTIADNIIKKLEKISEDLKNLKHLKEFEIPRKRRLTYTSLKSLQQAKIMEQAQEGSILLSLVNKTILKSGRSYFTKFQGKYTNKIKLQEHKMTVPLPQGEFKDPIGQVIIRYQCRTKRRIQ